MSVQVSRLYPWLCTVSTLRQSIQLIWPVNQTPQQFGVFVLKQDMFIYLTVVLKYCPEKNLFRHVLFPNKQTSNPGVVAHTLNPSPQRAEAGGSLCILLHPILYREFQTSQRYIVLSCVLVRFFLATLTQLELSGKRKLSWENVSNQIVCRQFCRVFSS